jgi:hypothetical protein
MQAIKSSEKGLKGCEEVVKQIPQQDFSDF